MASDNAVIQITATGNVESVNIEKYESVMDDARQVQCSKPLALVLSAVVAFSTITPVTIMPLQSNTSCVNIKKAYQGDQYLIPELTVESDINIIDMLGGGDDMPINEVRVRDLDDLRDIFISKIDNAEKLNLEKFNHIDTKLNNVKNDILLQISRERTIYLRWIIVVGVSIAGVIIAYLNFFNK